MSRELEELKEENARLKSDKIAIERELVDFKVNISAIQCRGLQGMILSRCRLH